MDFSVKVIEKNNLKLVWFKDNGDLNWLYDLQEKYYSMGKGDQLVYLCLNGTQDPNLKPENFLVENYEDSLYNHFLWCNLWTDEEIESYIDEQIKVWKETGEKLVIEHYELSKTEPYYDYT